MTLMPFDYEMHQSTFYQMHAAILTSMTEAEKKFLLGFEAGEPDWTLFPVPAIKDLPAVRWKLLNVQKFKQSNPDRHTDSLDKLLHILA